MSLKRRTGTQRPATPWPFLYSVVPERGIVQNLPPAPAVKPRRAVIHVAPPKRRSL